MVVDKVEDFWDDGLQTGNYSQGGAKEEIIEENPMNSYEYVEILLKKATKE